MPFPLSPRRTYDELVSIERARVLSYRADNIVTVDCDANDPAGEMEHVSGAAPFSVLNTPSEGWSHLWICLLYTSPSPRDKRQSRMPSSA